MTCKIVLEMTYNVSSGTLSLYTTTVTNYAFDRETDGQSSHRYRPRLHSMQRGKNQEI